MYGLADCNNFYASCERMFAPDLNGRPVVVLSNNDGCIIARSDEAKALGLKMGDAYFQQAAFLRQNNVAVFSSNLELYGDMSTRVMNTLKSYSPATEVYSIDESFMDFTGIDPATLRAGDRATSEKEYGHPDQLGYRSDQNAGEDRQ